MHCHASCSTQSYTHLEFFFSFSIDFITISLVLTFLKLFGKIASRVCNTRVSVCWHIAGVENEEFSLHLSLILKYFS